jgi:hypothetical protein
VRLTATIQLRHYCHVPLSEQLFDAQHSSDVSLGIKGSPAAAFVCLFVILTLSLLYQRSSHHLFQSYNLIMPARAWIVERAAVDNLPSYSISWPSQTGWSKEAVIGLCSIFVALLCCIVNLLWPAAFIECRGRWRNRRLLPHMYCFRCSLRMTKTYSIVPNV